jgi:hypothetical protein
MAVAQLNLSRRALLGAAFAAPVLSMVEGPVLAAAAGRGGEGFVLSRHPGLDPGSRSPPPGQPSSWTPGRARGDGAREARGAASANAPSSTSPTAARPAPTRWSRALAAWHRADAAIAAAAHEEDQDRYDRLGAAHDRALVRLLTAPAPDAAGLTLKLELAIDQLTWEHRRGDACMAALLADARRLAAQAS